MRAPKILDLYCGIGGLSLGFLLGVRSADVVGLDIDRYAVETYAHNLGRFGAKAQVRDVLGWDPRGDYDLVMGGSPCQPFSLANTKRKGGDHPLYPTFPRFFDVVLALRPKAFLLENVKGLVTRRHRPLLEGQLARVRDRYAVAWRVLNAAHYGVPQRRERLFILGVRRELGIAPSFPAPTHAERETKTLDGGVLRRWITVREAIGDLLSIPPAGPSETARPSKTWLRKHRPLEDLGSPAPTVVPKAGADSARYCRPLVPVLVPVADHEVKAYSMRFSEESLRKHPPQRLDGPSSTVRATFWKVPPDATLPVIVVRAGRDDVREYRDSPSPTLMDIGASGPRQGRPLVLDYRVTWKDMEPMDTDGPSRTLTTDIARNVKRPHNPIFDGVAYRRLTVRECLRLQSFPDWWTFPEGVSTSRKYRLVGEAVPPVLAYRLATHIAKLLGWETREPEEGEWALPYFHRAFPETKRDGEGEAEEDLGDRGDGDG